MSLTARKRTEGLIIVVFWKDHLPCSVRVPHVLPARDHQITVVAKCAPEHGHRRRHNLGLQATEEMRAISYKRKRLLVVCNSIFRFILQPLRSTTNVRQGALSAAILRSLAAAVGASRWTDQSRRGVSRCCKRANTGRWTTAVVLDSRCSQPRDLTLTAVDASNWGRVNHKITGLIACCHGYLVAFVLIIIIIIIADVVNKTSPRARRHQDDCFQLGAW